MPGSSLPSSRCALSESGYVPARQAGPFVRNRRPDGPSRPIGKPYARSALDVPQKSWSTDEFPCVPRSNVSCKPPAERSFSCTPRPPKPPCRSRSSRPASTAASSRQATPATTRRGPSSSGAWIAGQPCTRHVPGRPVRASGGTDRTCPECRLDRWDRRWQRRRCSDPWPRCLIEERRRQRVDLVGATHVDGLRGRKSSVPRGHTLALQDA